MKTGDHLPNQDSPEATLVTVLEGATTLLLFIVSRWTLPEWTSQPEAEETGVPSERMHLFNDVWTTASGVSYGWSVGRWNCTVQHSSPVLVLESLKQGLRALVQNGVACGTVRLGEASGGPTSA